MIRLITCVKKRDDVSPEQFRRYWRDPRFSDLVERMQALFGAKRSAMNVTLDVEANVRLQELRGTREPYDGVLEYWWDHAGAVLETAETAEAKALMEEMKAYQQQFIDFGASTAFFTDA
jgi:hypothetical protein